MRRAGAVCHFGFMEMYISNMQKYGREWTASSPTVFHFRNLVAPSEATL